MEEFFKYKNIVNLNNMEKMRESINLISHFIEEAYDSHSEKVKELIWEQLGIFNNHHFTEETADYVVRNMHQSCGELSVETTLDNNGICPEKARELIQSACNDASSIASQKGVSAPRIPSEYNDYDYYVTMAMCISDFWMTCDGDLHRCAILGYEWMSDPDSCPTKVWDYFF